MPYMHLLLIYAGLAYWLQAHSIPDCNDKSCSARSLKLQTIIHISAAGDDE